MSLWMSYCPINEMKIALTICLCLVSLGNLVTSQENLVETFCSTISGNYSSATGSCFKLYNQMNKKWNDASDVCKSEPSSYENGNAVYGRVAHLKSPESFAFIREAFVHLTWARAFVGVRATVPESLDVSTDFRWLEDYNTFTDCVDPNSGVSFLAGGDNQDCFVVKKTESSSSLEDWGCYSTNFWICEFVSADIVVQTPPESCPMPAIKKQQRDECTALKGIYTGPACYIPVKTQTDGLALGQNEAFSLCPSGTMLAHLYDLKTVKDMLASLKWSHAGQWFWTAGRVFSGSGPAAGFWMKDPSTLLRNMSMVTSEQAEFPERYTAVLTGDICLSVFISSDVDAMYQYQDCAGILAGQPLPPMGALCMKYTPIADFNTIDGKRVATSEPIKAVSGIQSPWFCGLECRRDPGCLQYNYNQGSEECQLFGHKVHDEIEWPAGYSLVTDADWSTYVRVY